MSILPIFIQGDYEVVLKNTRIRSDAQRLEVWEPLTEYQELWFRRLTEMSINKTEVADVTFRFSAFAGHGRYPLPVLLRRQRVQRRHWRLKTLSVAYKGGCCVRCGFDHMGALVFHHRNPSEKNFQISGGGIRSWPRIKKELDKCDILCANCHGEIHAEITRAFRPEKKPGMCKNATCTSPLPPSKRGSPRKYTTETLLRNPFVSQIESTTSGTLSEMNSISVIYYAPIATELNTGNIGKR